MGYLSHKNSTIAALGSSGQFIGEWEDCLNYESIVVACKTDADGTIYVDFSNDENNVDSTLTYNVSAGVNEVHRITVTRVWARVRYVNGGSAQTYLRLSLIFGNQTQLTSNINSTIQSDADAIVTRGVLTGQTDSGQFANVPVTTEGHLEVAIHSPRLPFGSIHTESLHPIFQSDAVYGLNSGQTNSGASLSGAATASNSMFTVSTGTTNLSQAYIQSRKRLRYRAGQGVVGKFAGLFGTPASRSYQLMGFGHAEDGVYFGYKEVAGATPSFGILYVNRGVREVRTLTITVGATSASNCTIKLNDVDTAVALTNASNVNRTAYDISLGVYSGWKSYPIGATVIFIADSAGAKAGTFSFSAGTTGASASFALTRVGEAASETFIAQADWNGDTMDGNGLSGATLNPQFGNVYQVGIQYLGFGTISFQIEVAPDGGNNADFVTVHTLKLPNTLSATSFGNPSFPFTMAVYSAGSTTDLVCKVGSFGGFIEGNKVLHGNRFTYFNSSSLVTSGALRALFTFTNKLTYAGRANQAVINLLSVTGSCEHNNPVVFYLIKNATLVGNPVFADLSTISCSSWDTAATTCTYSDNSQLFWTGHVGSTGEIDHHFNGGTEELTLQPGESFTIACKSLGAGSPTFVTASVNTREDQ